MSSIDGQPATIVEVVAPGGPPGPQGPAGPPGPPSSLVDLSDVTGAPGPGLSPVGDPTGVSQDFPLTRITTEDDLDAILTSVAATNWQPITLEPGWTNLGDPWTPARYRHTLNSTVYIEGHITYDQPITASSDPITIARLPAEIAPNVAITYAVPGAGPSMSYVNVYADGHIDWVGYISGSQGAEGFLALSAIIYSLDRSTLVADALKARFG